MGLPGIKISSIWRVAILLGLSILLYGCATYSANIKEGSFDVNPPKPFFGPGTYVYPDVFNFRVAFAYTIEEKETFPLKGVEKESSSNGDADINYFLESNPVSGYLDIYYKINIFDWGGRVAMEPYPSILFFAGINALYGECGVSLRIGYSKDDASYSGHYNYYSMNGIDDDGDFQEQHSLHNANIGINLFSSLFIIKNLSLNFSTGFYQPWFFRRSIYIGDADIPHDYDITIDFPYLLSQYAGASFIILEHVQFSAGETVFYTPYSDKLHWQTTFSMSYLF